MSLGLSWGRSARCWRTTRSSVSSARQGCPFLLPDKVNARSFLAAIELDVHNSDSEALMRAIFCASIFHE
jgi:hypothetical protein